MKDIKYLSSELPIKDRVDDLLSRMTVREKVNQMVMPCSLSEAEEKLNNGDLPYGISCLFADKNVSKERINALQKLNREKSRLGIPILIMGESLHGVMQNGATIFPQSIAMGATFNPKLMGEIATVIGEEARSFGIRQTFAPDLDLAREPRWGRTEECFSEDPYLTARMGEEYVKGLQSNGVSATPKHFIGHGSPEGGINIAPPHVGLRELLDVMREPFECAINAGAMSIMPAYSEFDGVPMHASSFMLQDLLRDDMGFKGYTFSDFCGTDMTVSVHYTANGPLNAGKDCLDAGLDIEAPRPYVYGNEFLSAVESGEIDIEKIDNAVSRILYVKFALGLFENAIDEKFVNLRSERAIKLSRQASEESIVLLENNGVLPLKKDSKIALIGPNADLVQLGDYTSPDVWDMPKTIKQVLSERLNGKLLYSKGCDISKIDDKTLNDAVSIAKSADVTILVLGDNSRFFGGIGWGNDSNGDAVTCGEGFDSHDLLLPEAQRILFNKIKAVSKKLVTVLSCGRPYAILDEKNGSDALIESFYAGEQGAEALVDVLYGDVNPSGRLPVSHARSVGHLPCFYNKKVSAGGFYKSHGSKEKSGRDYVFDSPESLYSFGYGLSYTTFEYKNLNVKTNGTKVNVTVTVKNTGKVAGKETILLYLKQHYCKVTPYVKRLRAFDKIYLNPGEEKTVEFVLTDKDFIFVNEKYQREIGYGEYSVMIEKLISKFSIEKGE